MATAASLPPAGTTREGLIAEEKAAQASASCDSAARELCWHDPRLWWLAELTDPLPAVSNLPQLMCDCVRYLQSLDEQLPQLPRTQEEAPPSTADRRRGDMIPSTTFRRA